MRAPSAQSVSSSSGTSQAVATPHAQNSFLNLNHLHIQQPPQFDNDVDNDVDDAASQAPVGYAFLLPIF